MANRIEELKVGDDVIVTIKAKVIEHGERSALGPAYVNLDYMYDDYACLGLSNDDLATGIVTIERIATPLPTEEGRYVTRSNANDIQGAQIHTLEGGVWSQFTGEKVIENSLDAPWGTRYAHENLGGLVRLVPEQ